MGLWPPASPPGVPWVMDSSAEDTGPSFLPSWKLAKDRWEQHWESQALLETSEGSVSVDAFGEAPVPPWLHPLQAHSPMGPSSSLAPPSLGSLTNGPQFCPGSTLFGITHQWESRQAAMLVL